MCVWVGAVEWAGGRVGGWMGGWVGGLSACVHACVRMWVGGRVCVCV